MIKKKIKKRNNLLIQNLPIIIGFVFVIVVVIFSSFLTSFFEVDNPKIDSINYEKYDILEFDDRIRGSNPYSELDFIIFTDFRCSACITQYPIIKKLMQEYPNVNFMYKHLVGQTQELSFYAAESYECARMQGKGYEIADFMYTNPNFKSIDIQREAENIGLDMNIFKNCTQSENMSRLIQSDANHGVFLEVQGTPTVFVNGIMIEGAYSYEVYSAFIEKELKK